MLTIDIQNSSSSLFSTNYWCVDYGCTCRKENQKKKSCSDRSAATPRPDHFSFLFFFLIPSGSSTPYVIRWSLEFKLVLTCRREASRSDFTPSTYKERCIEKFRARIPIWFPSYFFQFPFVFVQLFFFFCVSALISIARPSPAPFCFSFLFG